MSTPIDEAKFQILESSTKSWSIYLPALRVVFDALKTFIFDGEGSDLCSIIDSHPTWHKNLATTKFKTHFSTHSAHTLFGSQIRMGNFISSLIVSLVALSKYSIQKLKISSSGSGRSFGFLKFRISWMLPNVVTNFQIGVFSLNIYSQA